MNDWVIEGPRHIERSSVIAQNHYERVDLPKLKREIERQLKFQQGKTLNESNNIPS
jgi:NADH-quinone oxidoreductase subunit G